MLNRNIFLFIFIAIFFAGCASYQDSSVNNDKDVVISRISFPDDSKFIVIPVSLKGKEYLFTLDTGAAMTVFDISLKDQLGWRLGSSKARAADGTSFKMERFMLDHAHFGGVCKKHEKVSVMDLSHVSKMAGRRIDGIVGMDILKNHIVRLDFEKNIVSFLKSINKSELSECESGLSFKKNRVYLNGKVGNIPVRFVIDTGFADSDFTGLLEPEVIKQLGVIGTDQGSQGSTIVGPMDIDQRKITVTKLRIGQIEYDYAMFVEHHESILGLDFLSRHIVTFDFPHKKVYLNKTANLNHSSSGSLSITGFDFTVINNNNNIVIESIDTNGLGYKKGFRKDDVILKVNNHDVPRYNLSKFTNFVLFLLKEQDLNYIDFTIKRNGEIKEIIFLDKRK
jgi:hypothetical protein